MATVFRKGATAVITGGASGIGLALAKKCAGYGMRVLVADNDAKLLASIPKDVAALTLKMDVTKPNDWANLKKKVEDEFGGKVSLLALNAGIGPKSSWESPEAFHAIMDVNYYGVVHGITTFLPLVKQSGSAAEPSAIVITGSKQGITNPPGNPAYNASKAAVKALAEHLSFDLRSNAAATSVHLLVPGWTWTGLAGGVAGELSDSEGAAARKRPGAWWPEQVVDYLVQKMAEGQFWVLCPDNEVTEEMDRKRMLWAAGDAVEGRLPLSRWREEYKDQVAQWMAK
ncbi:hypothetical protein HDV00_000494 [Rhizophlyctis rosea]|nr:hypothetical protein HDV00_000494 [Rhizophlyctis rosea]